MKRILSICIIFTLCSCSKNNITIDNKKSEFDENKNIQENIIEEEQIDSYIDNNNTPVGLYLYKNRYSPRELITEYITDAPMYSDIGSFEVFFSKENTISGDSFKIVFGEYYNNSIYKVGFHIKVNTTDGIFERNIFKDSDKHDFFNYVQLYLYDDFNAPDGIYSHLEDKDFNDNTIITSIKLTASTYIDKVNDIELSVFTYDNDDFDKDGNYRGNSKYTINVKKA